MKQLLNWSGKDQNSENKFNDLLESNLTQAHIEQQQQQRASRSTTDTLTDNHYTSANTNHTDKAYYFPISIITSNQYKRKKPTKKLTDYLAATTGNTEYK